MRHPDFNFLSSLPKCEFERFRKVVIELVLATDMKQHFSILSHFTTVHRCAEHYMQLLRNDCWLGLKVLFMCWVLASVRWVKSWCTGAKGPDSACMHVMFRVPAAAAAAAARLNAGGAMTPGTSGSDPLTICLKPPHPQPTDTLLFVPL
jgi:hypothetical protein